MQGIVCLRRMLRAETDARHDLPIGYGVRMRVRVKVRMSVRMRVRINVSFHGLGMMESVEFMRL